MLIFWENDFPFADTVKMSSTKEIIDALPPMESVRSVGVEELKTRLNRESADMLINPFGSAFPKEAWPEILEFLHAGGNLLNLGGALFSVPVVNDEGNWIQEPCQDTYYRELGISAIYPIDISTIEHFDTLPEEPIISGLVDHLRCERAYEIQFDLTNGAITPAKTSVRERTLHPLLYAIDTHAEMSPGRVATPVVAIDHTSGPFAGGRWVLANLTPKTPLRREILSRLSGFTALGITEFHVRPSFAYYNPDERPTLIVHANFFGNVNPESKPPSIVVTIKKEKNIISSETIEIDEFHSPYYREIRLAYPLGPGLYTIEAVLTTGDKDLTDKFSPHSISGFWCYDDILAAHTQALLHGKHSFMRGDKPSLMIGTTYTAPDAGDQLFFDPNPAIWERDFSLMYAAGVNLIHTGFCGNLRHAMLVPGVPSEVVLRAVTTLMLTAAKYDMTVLFSLFAFKPEAWDGEDGYTDPNSLIAQKEFVAAITRRLNKFNNILWCAIDEPLLPVRNNDEMSDPQELFRTWVDEIAKVIRQNGNHHQLVTVGQADGRWAERPNPCCYEDAIDFASVHTSWKNDDALCTTLSGTLPNKPTVILETGHLPGDDIETTESSTEEISRNLLERKLVTAIASGASGAVEWMHSTNSHTTVYEPIPVGMMRSDRTPKSEFEIIPTMREFQRKLRTSHIEPQPEDICIVIPQAGILSHPEITSMVTSNSIRTMQSHCGIPVRVLGEDSLKHLGTPRMIILPSPGLIGREAWKASIKAAESGCTLLVTGPVDDVYKENTADRLSKLGIQVQVKEIAEIEKLIIFGAQYELNFGRNAPFLRKAVVAGTLGQIKNQPIGDGKIIYTGLPFEAALNSEPMIALYEYAVIQAAVKPPSTIEPADPGIALRSRFFKKAILYTMISELDVDKEFTLGNSLTAHTYIVNIPARRSVMLLTNRDTGSIIAQYGGEAVEV